MKMIISVLLITLTILFTGCISPNTSNIQNATTQTDTTINNTTQDNKKEASDKVETTISKNDNVGDSFTFDFAF